MEFLSFLFSFQAVTRVKRILQAFSFHGGTTDCSIIVRDVDPGTIHTDTGLL